MPTLPKEEIAALQPDVPEWRVGERDGIQRIERTFAFDDFVSAMDFARRVGDIAESEGHHPDLHVAWGSVRVETWTHKIRGLHRNDFILAAKVDELFAVRAAAAARKKGVIDVLGVDFFEYPTTNVKRTQEFWRDVMGLEPGEEFESWWSEFDVRPSTICFTPVEDDQYPGSPCVALAVADIHAAVAALKARGVKVIHEPHETGVCWMSYVEDPDGNRVCIHQRKDGTSG